MPEERTLLLPYLAATHGDLAGILEVREESFGGFVTDGGILDQRVKLVVDGHAEHVEVRRAHAYPASVNDTRLGVHHLALPFPNPDAM